VVVRVKLDFNDNFKQLYSNFIYWRTASGWKATHYFSIRYFIGDLGNGGYIDVIRNESGWVSSWPDWWLNWSYLGTEILWGKEFQYDLDKLFVASKKFEPGKQFISQEPIKWIRNYKWKTIPIGFYLSNDEWTLIKEMEIIYTGDENAIELVK
jgi:hypothetical protein